MGEVAEINTEPEREEAASAAPPHTLSFGFMLYQLGRELSNVCSFFSLLLVLQAVRFIRRTRGPLPPSARLLSDGLHAGPGEVF